jgi:hypothetical protein
VLGDRADQFGLAGEVVVGRRLADLGPAGDLAEGQGVHAPLGQDLAARLEQTAS